MPHEFFCQDFSDLAAHTAEFPKHRMTKSRDDKLKFLQKFSSDGTKLNKPSRRRSSKKID